MSNIDNSQIARVLRRRAAAIETGDVRFVPRPALHGECCLLVCVNGQAEHPAWSCKEFDDAGHRLARFLSDVCRDDMTDAEYNRWLAWDNENSGYYRASWFSDHVLKTPERAVAFLRAAAERIEQR